MQGTVTLSDGVLSITGELQIHSQGLNPERCYYHLGTFRENKTIFESGWPLLTDLTSNSLSVLSS